MTTAIERLIKMHDPRCVSIESLNIGRGRAILTKDQILGTFATCQHIHPVGFDILMTKYRNDCKAKQSNAYGPQLVCGCINDRIHPEPLLPAS